MVNMKPGQTLGRGDLNIFLVDSQNVPTNAAEISFALYFYDESGPVPVEVLIGGPNRTPVNPQIGEYYAALQVPPAAISGEYHIKWTFRQYVSSPVQQVVQIFKVLGQNSTLGIESYSLASRMMIDKLRMHLRDQCVGGEEEVEVEIDGGLITVRMDDLWDILIGQTKQHEKIQAAFKSGKLRTRTVSPTGMIEWKHIIMVNRAEVPWETIYRGATEKGPFVLTVGHRIFISPTEKITMEQACKSGSGTSLLCVSKDGEPDPIQGSWGGDSKVGICLMQNCGEIEHRQFMYDLTTEDWHNFILIRSGIVVSNSPDKFYHFRPPEHEGDLGQYNRVFGQVWEDRELYEYLVSALDWCNMFPPMSHSMASTLDLMVSGMPSWKTAIIWYGIVQACFALMANWTVDEFSYSIGGVSLDIEKSSKYQSLMDAANNQFDKATEAKPRTVKFIKGLQQPRHGLGTRSAFGPNLGRGILSPRNFI